MNHADRQKALFEGMHDEYERHYFDAHSLEYRRRRVYPRLFAGADLRGKRVAELYCGSGFNSLEIRRMFPGAETVGFDISPPAVRAYRRVVGTDAYELDITSGRPPAAAGRFDCAVCMGGLHHTAHDLPGAFRTVRTLLADGGDLFVYEPNKEFILESVRRLWYRLDRHFDEIGERALSPAELESASGARCRSVSYLGGLAYYLILNSMVLRIPPAAKRLLAGPLIALDGLTDSLPLKRPYPAFVARLAIPPSDGAKS